MRLLVFCLVFCLPVSAWGGGYWISEEQLTALENNLNQQIKALSEVKSELSISSWKLSESEFRLNGLKMILGKSKEELTLAQEDLEKSRKELKEALTSLEQSEVSGWIKLGAGVLAGFGLGYILAKAF